VLLNFVAASQFLQEAIFGIFFIFILYIIQHQCSYQAMMLFIFISLFFAVSFMIYFLTPVQNQINPNTYSSYNQFVYADSIISFIYYVFAMIFCFYPYREFKAIAFNENPALRNYFESNPD
jgi:ABC-type Mn2+/Zn2+ transport system permease subunit